MRKYLFVALFLILSLISCSEEAPDFTGKWNLDYIEFSNEKIYANQLGEPVYTFENDGKYTIEVGGVSQYGKWKYSKNTITFTNDQNSDTKVNILELSDSTFIYAIENSDEDKTFSKVHFKK